MRWWPSQGTTWRHGLARRQRVFCSGLNSNNKLGGDELTLDAADGTGLEFQKEWKEQRIIAGGDGVSRSPKLGGTSENLDWLAMQMGREIWRS